MRVVLTDEAGSSRDWHTLDEGHDERLEQSVKPEEPVLLSPCSDGNRESRQSWSLYAKEPSHGDIPRLALALAGNRTMG